MLLLRRENSILIIKILSSYCAWSILIINFAILLSRCKMYDKFFNGNYSELSISSGYKHPGIIYDFACAHVRDWSCSFTVDLYSS